MANRLPRPTKAVKVNGVIVRKQVSPKEVKATIMRANNWTEEQYRKESDIFKNKLRAYESYQRESGRKVDRQSPQTILYKQALAKRRAQRRGEEYHPNARMQRIQSMSAYSITKGKEVFKAGTAQRKAEDVKTLVSVETKMAKFIKAHPDEVRRIQELYGDNPAKYETAMGWYAERVHAKADAEGNYTGEEPIAYGERAGSPETPFDEAQFEAVFAKMSE